MFSQNTQSLSQQLNFLLKIRYDESIVNLFASMIYTAVLIPIILFCLHFVKNLHGFKKYDGHCNEYVEYAAGEVRDEGYRHFLVNDREVNGPEHHA